MTCPGCGFENPEGFRFCGECGAELPRRPVGPATEARAGRDPRSYTPAHLARRILTSRAALEGERKRVTVLFADVKSSLELSESIDPEDLHRVLDGFFTILTEGVHRYDGTVNQYTGDGIMALFGAPVALEDHAQRACHAALWLGTELHRYADELRRERGFNFSVRMGLNSGEVVVGRIGDDLRMDYTAQGQTVGLAQRMEALAEPGKVFLTLATADLVAGLFELRDLGEFQIRGVRTPQRVFELVGPGPLRTRLDRSRERGFARLVGRERDLRVLESALEAAERGEGGAVGLVAEPGIGKSRLCHELAERARERALAVHEAHAVSHGRLVPFLPIVELLRSRFDVREGDPPGAARRKIAGTLVLENPELERTLPLAFEFLGVPDPARRVRPIDPDERQQRLFRLVERIVLARDRAEPSLVVIDDLHWIDAGSRALLEHLVGAISASHTLLLVNYRPSYRPPWSGSPHWRELELRPLEPDAVRELLREGLGEHPSVAGLAIRISEEVGGNPFFLEELVRSLVESGTLEGERGAYRLARDASHFRVPETVHAVLAARIDALPELHKEVLQTAAVIGRRFSTEVLRRVVGVAAAEVAAVLDELLARGLIEAQGETGFRHPLTREVAYRTQLFDRRARLHGAVARAMQELASGSLDERAALLAHHWAGAGEPVEAARWHQRAATWAGQTDPAEAYRHWKNVRTLLGDRSDSEELAYAGLAAHTALLDLGWRFGMPAGEAERVYADGRALAEALADDAALARLLMAYGQIIAWSGASDGQTSVELGLEAARLADATDDVELRAAARGQLARAYWRARDYRSSLAAIEQGLARAPDSNMHLRFRARVLTEMARLDEARRDLDRALELARESGDVSEQTLTHLCYAVYARFTGDFELERAHAQSALDLAERTRDLFGRTQSRVSLGESHLWLGRYDDAIATLESALALARERHTSLYAEAGMLGLLADAYLGAGRLDRARATAEQANALEGAHSIQALLALARVLQRTEGKSALDRIERTLHYADDFIDRSGATSWTPHVRVARAHLGDAPGQAKRELETARAELLAMSASKHAAEVEKLLKELEG